MVEAALAPALLTQVLAFCCGGGAKKGGCGGGHAALLALIFSTALKRLKRGTAVRQRCVAQGLRRSSCLALVLLLHSFYAVKAGKSLGISSVLQAASSVLRSFC